MIAATNTSLQWQAAMSSLHRCVHGNIPSCKSRQNITSLLKQPKEGSSCEAYTYSVGSEWMSQSHESLVTRVMNWQIAREKEGTQTVKKTISRAKWLKSFFLEESWNLVIRTLTIAWASLIESEIQSQSVHPRSQKTAMRTRASNRRTNNILLLRWRNAARAACTSTHANGAVGMRESPPRLMGKLI